jgi:hypothetical protein
MKSRRSWVTGVALAAAGLAMLPACSRRKAAEINPIAASFAANRNRAPLGSAIEVTYAWELEPAAKKLAQEYRALVHFLDKDRRVLFTDDHVPTPDPSAWEPGRKYSYKRTVFVPINPYVGKVEVAMGLYPTVGKGERIAIKGEDIGLRAYKAAELELLPQTENIFVVLKEGWHSPETSPSNPNRERQWTKKEALASFKNPRKDVVVYLEADTNYKAFSQPPVLTLAIGAAGVTIPVENSEVFLRKIRVKGADLGSEDWVDIKFAMNQSFVPKNLTPPLNNDDRELGLLVYHLYVAEADRVGELAADELTDAAPLAASPGAKAVAKATAKPAPPAKKP